MSILPPSASREARIDRHVLPESVSTTSEEERLFGLVRVVGQRDILTYEHSRRVAIYAQRLARAIGFSRVDSRRFALAGLVHDLGKVWIPDAILKKTGPLNDEEYQRIRQHAEIGGRLIDAHDMSAFYRDAVYHHHEAFDGSGYPDGLSGDSIPEAARLLAIVDAFDVITSERPYKVPSSLAEALDEINRGAGTHFDPTLATMFVDLARHQPQFLTPARLCAVQWDRTRASAWYQIATGF